VEGLVHDRERGKGAADFFLFALTGFGWGGLFLGSRLTRGGEQYSAREEAHSKNEGMARHGR
jgi:hypothetical protein